jgi:hypothetical protein
MARISRLFSVFRKTLTPLTMLSLLPESPLEDSRLKRTFKRTSGTADLPASVTEKTRIEIPNGRR